MKAVRYHRPKSVSVDDVDEPSIEHPRDAVLRVTSTALCGSDLHLYNGFLPQMRPMTLGHEFMGIVEEVGDEVTNIAVGDRVVVPFPIADGSCWFCSHGLPSQCEVSNEKNYGPGGGTVKDKGGGIFGYSDLYGGYEGGQAEKVRVPFVDYGARKVPDSMRDEQVLFLTDILPTGWQAIDWAKVQPGETVAVFGCGPVGIMALKVAKHLGATTIGVDLLDYRLDIAKRTADCITINANDDDAVEMIRDMTDGRGADVCVDAVGQEAHRNLLQKANALVHMQRGSMKALTMAFDAVRRGGRVSVVGVYATTYDNFPVGQMFDKELQVYAGQALVHEHIDHLMGLVTSGKIRTDDIITHTMPLEEAPRAYEMFNKKEDDCLKVVFKP